MPDDSDDFWKTIVDWNDIRRLILSSRIEERLGGLDTIARFGNPPPDILQQVVDCLYHEDDRVRAGACVALARFDGLGLDVVARLKEFAKNTGGREFKPAVGTLAVVTGFDAEILGSLMPLLSHEEGFVRREALSALRTMGSRAEPALLALIAALSDDWCPWRGGWWDGYSNDLIAAEALGKIGAPAAPELDKLLASADDYKWDSMAILAITELGPAAAISLEKLKRSRNRLLAEMPPESPQPPIWPMFIFFLRCAQAAHKRHLERFSKLNEKRAWFEARLRLITDAIDSIQRTRRCD